MAPRKKPSTKKAAQRGVHRKERGESRAIYVTVQDDPEFLALTKDGKLLWYTLKLRLGASGIAVVYRGELSDKTGIAYDDIERTLEELREAQWIVREQNVIWMRNGLRFDPYMTMENRIHVSAICKHLSGLPKLNIINDFCAYYQIDPTWVAQGVPDTVADTVPTTVADTVPPTVGHTLTATGGRKKEVGDRIKEVNQKEKNLARAREADSSPGVAVAAAEEFPPDDSGVIHPTQRLSGSQVMHAWESRQPARVPIADRPKHLQIAKRIADNHTAEEVAAAFIGMGQLFPHCDGEPWDLADLHRKFAKALAKARDHPELRRLQREAELMQLLEAAG